MDVTKTIAKGALYEVVTAQLQGGGNITRKVIIGDAVKVGHASGGYNICHAQLNSDPINGGWEDTAQCPKRQRSASRPPPG